MISVRKATGDLEPFSEEKVRSSIGRARIPETLQAHVLQHVKSKLYDQIPTSEIYHHITEFLENSQEPFARSRYSLKESLMALGPTGYPFEDYIAAVLQTHGFTVAVRQVLLGRCVSHEIDVVATREGKKIMVEVKFHNGLGTRSEIHVALYTQARFLDVREKHTFDEPWLVTNTKVTSDALAYASCMGMGILSWSYPEHGSLRDIIEKHMLYPVTMISSLSIAQKALLLQNHVVMCMDICRDESLLAPLALSNNDRAKVLEEVSYVCSK